MSGKSSDDICKNCGRPIEQRSLVVGGGRVHVWWSHKGQFGSSSCAATKAEPKDSGEKVEMKTEKDNVCEEILRIMETYHEQDKSPYGVDTPGGLEHMGDVWRLFSKWEARLITANSKGGESSGQ